MEVASQQFLKGQGCEVSHSPILLHERGDEVEVTLLGHSLGFVIKSMGANGTSHKYLLTTTIEIYTMKE